MKKPYEAPEILFEDFSLSSSIAAGCETKTPLASFEASCGYPVRGGIVFAAEPNCTHPSENGVYDNFCYHTPTDTNNLFNS